jgi:hypothetical protein
MFVSLILLAAILYVFLLIGRQWFRRNPKYAPKINYFYGVLALIFIIGLFAMWRGGKFG